MKFSRMLNQRVVKLENQLTAAQKALDANRPSVFKEVLDEADHVLAPCISDWILKTSIPDEKWTGSRSLPTYWHYTKAGN